MFEEHARIHDKLSLEIKLGFKPLRKQKSTTWLVNTWIFVPRSLDITTANYQKADFYRDLKSNIRLITPIFSLRDIAENTKSPLSKLEASLHMLANNYSRSQIANYEYHIRLFLAVLKSSIRNEISHIVKNLDGTDTLAHIEKYVNYISLIAAEYRKLRPYLIRKESKIAILNYFNFGDEFMCNIIEHNTFKLLQQLKDDPTSNKNEFILPLTTIIQNEINYKKEQGFPYVQKESPDNNRRLLSRLGVLKKFSESELYLNTLRRKDGIIIEQIYLSIAAGLSMVLATAIAFSFQQKYGNFTMPFFVALVVSYMLKDRLKELARHFFAHKLGRFYFDQKTNISLKNHVIGYLREALDHIDFKNVPNDIIKLRSRASVFTEYAGQHADSVLLYRKVIKLNRRNLEKTSKYAMPGINEIIRMNVSEFLRKMDNPKIPLYVPNKFTDFEIIKGEKVYYLNLILQVSSNRNIAYTHYRIVMNRSGIIEIEKIQ